MMKIRFWLLSSLGLLLLFSSVIQVKAVDLTESNYVITKINEDQYHYEIPDIGGFDTNVTNGESYQSVCFIFDTTLSWEMFRGNEIFTYQNQDILEEGGKYSLFVYNSDDEADYIYLEFTIGVDETAQGTDDGIEILKDSELLTQIGNLDIEEKELIMGYQAREKQFIYTLNKDPVITTDIPIGAVITKPVMIEVSELASIMVYCNNKYIETPVDYIYETPGVYRLEIQEYSGADVNQMGITQGTFYFTITEPITSTIGVITAPEEFEITAVKYMGEEITYDADYLFLKKDGAYSIQFDSKKWKNTGYELQISKDTTAPFIEFDKDVYTEDGVEAPVSFSANDSKAQILLYSGGVERKYQNNTIANGGNYQIIIKDQAGNMREYNIFIKNNYEILDKRIILILSIVIVGIIIWIIHTRKNYRVL